MARIIEEALKEAFAKYEKENPIIITPSKEERMMDFLDVCKLPILIEWHSWFREIESFKLHNKDKYYDMFFKMSGGVVSSEDILKDLLKDICILENGNLWYYRYKKRTNRDIPYNINHTKNSIYKGKEFNQVYVEKVIFKNNAL